VNGQWNDYGNTTPVNGYVVEYGGSAGDPTLNITGNATVNVVYTPAINNITPSNGPTAGGTSVTIGGSNLAGATSVTFGGVSVPISSNTATSIVVTVPAHVAGQVDVVVTTGTGTATQTNGYVYIDAPTISTPLEGSYLTTTSVDFAGTASPGSTVTVKQGAATLCSAVADSGGAWTCNATLSQGARTVSVTSAIGSATTGPVTRSFTVDSLAPAAPVIDPVSPTNDTTPSFGGTAEPGSTVNVTVDGAVVCTVVADGAGVWGCSSNTILSEDDHTISATATDAAGNVGPAAADQSFAVDITKPGAPVVSIPVDGSATNDSTPTFTGTAEADTLVTVRNGTTILCTVTADGSGAWSCPSGVVLAEDNYNLSATATDAAGNESTDTTFALEVDLTKPVPPVIGSADVTGDVTPTFFGTAEPGATVNVTVDGAVVCTVVANGTGNWTCLAGATFIPGPHAVSATATDPAGNLSDPATQALTIDTTKPDSPTISSPAIMGDTTPVFAGTAEPNGTVNVFVDGVLYCTTTANGAGNWTCTSATVLTAGAHDVSATVKDAANNTSPPATQALTIDTGVPSAPVITSPAAVNDTTPTFGGTAEPGSTVTVRVDGVIVCTDVASASGAWSCQPAAPLAVGDRAVTATATDSAGNTSPVTNQALVVDTTAPAVPVVTSPASGPSADNTPTFAGTAEPGSTVSVMDGNTLVCMATVDGAGNWSCAPTVPLSEGNHTISITVGDPAGNTSLATELSVGIDTIAPSSPLITSRSNTLDPKPLLHGTAEPGSMVTVVFDPDNNPATNNSVTYVTTADPSGVWSVDTGSATPTSGTFPADGLVVGTRADVQVVARDAAGNISGATNQLLFVGTQLYWPLLLAS
jgi:hypothetical protein